MVTGEESANDLGLMFQAAAEVLGIQCPQAPALVLHDSKATGFKLGEQTTANWTLLRDALLAHGTTLLIVDTWAALFQLANENDNALITTLMMLLGRLAQETGCAILILAHAPKVSRETAAASRGEAVLVRGGSALVNSPRNVATISTPSAMEAGEIVLAGYDPATVRRIDSVKSNDSMPHAPIFFRLVSKQVPVQGGSQNVRAVEFIQMPSAGGGHARDDYRNVVMIAIDTGCMDAQGQRVPLSRGAGGRTNTRAAVAHCARALQNADLHLPEAHALTTAREVLRDLTDRIGCVVEEEVKVPRQTKGKANGTQPVKGLATRWALAPWVTSGPAPATAAPIAAAPATPDPGADAISLPITPSDAPSDG